MPFQHNFCPFLKIQGNMNEIFAEQCTEPKHIPNWKSWSYYLSVWIQHTGPEEKKCSIFAFQSGCIKLQETQLIKPRHTNHFQIISQNHFSIYIQEPLWFPPTFTRGRVWLGKSPLTWHSNTCRHFPIQVAPRVMYLGCGLFQLIET